MKWFKNRMFNVPLYNGCRNILLQNDTIQCSAIICIIVSFSGTPFKLILPPLSYSLMLVIASRGSSPSVPVCHNSVTLALLISPLSVVGAKNYRAGCPWPACSV